MKAVRVLLLVACSAGAVASSCGGSTNPASSSVSAAALDGLHFADVTRAAGLDHPQSNRLLTGAEAMTGGVAACDFFGNGLTDLYVTRVGMPNELFRNNGNGTFSDVALQAGVQGPDWKTGYSGATCGDLNGDGRPDLYLNSAGDTPSVLYLNNGNGAFSDVTAEAGLASGFPTGGSPGLMYGSAFGDYNHDGRLDIVTVQWDVNSLMAANILKSPGGIFGNGGGHTHPCAVQKAIAASSAGPGSVSSDRRGTVSNSRLWENQGNGPDGVPHFDNVTARMGLDFSGVLGFTPAFVDLTGNGWDDLVVTGDACTSRVWMNENGQRFADSTASSGANTAENGMGSAFVYQDGNGPPAWFETAIYYPGMCPAINLLSGCSGNRLYQANGNGTFRDATDQVGVRDGGWGWGAVAADFDNSGRTSLAVVDGNLWNPSQLVESPANPGYRFYSSFVRGSPRLWLNTGTAPWPQVAPFVGLITHGQEKAVVPIDLLRNGKIGLFITNTGADPVLYRNDTANHNVWVTVRLHDRTSGNTFGIGAKVRLIAAPGARSQYQELLDGGSYLSSNPLELHFGLGRDVSRVDEIDVFWPGQAQPQVLHDVAVNHYVDITRG